MKNIFKRTLSALMCLTLIFCLSSCYVKNPDDQSELRDYHDGYSEGYQKGVVDGQQKLGEYADYYFDDICSENDIEHALAILILSTDGETYTEKEIEDAIWTVSQFYDDVCAMVNSVENYSD